MRLLRLFGFRISQFVGAKGNFVTTRPLSSSSFLKMASKGDSLDSRDHMTVTATQNRDDDIHEMTVSKMKRLSPTVLSLTLRSKTCSPGFTFKAGQWVDMFIPNVPQIGGFSITSSPTQLKDTGELKFAVKYSESPPTKWVHSECHEGSSVSIRIGGNFFLDIPKLQKSMANLLFIAGGVGINPLASMIFEIHSLKFNLGRDLNSTLLYTAKTVDELIFRDAFDSIHTAYHLAFGVKYFVTGPSDRSSVVERNDNNVKYSRMTKCDIENAINPLLNSQSVSKADDQFVFICGPPEMISFSLNALHGLGIHEDHIFYEKWW